MYEWGFVEMDRLGRRYGYRPAQWYSVWAANFAGLRSKGIMTFEYPLTEALEHLKASIEREGKC